MAQKSKDPFLGKVGRHLGVDPREIQIHLSSKPGHFTCFGPAPGRPVKGLPKLPRVRNYCFTFVIRLRPPRAIIEALQEEYDELIALLPELIAAGDWSQVAEIIARLAELQQQIRNASRLRERAIRYCVFPDEIFNDPLLGDQTLPPRPPVPPLRTRRARRK